jgi:ferredoxin, 2Fe-2S
MRMVKLVVTNRTGKVVEVDARPGRSIMENIRDLEASVDAICGGMCACATCHIFIADGCADRIPPRSYEEQQMLRDSPYFDPDRSRLSCQIQVTEAMDGVAFTVAPEEI